VRWFLLVLLLFAVAWGCHQQEGTRILGLMFREELRLSYRDLALAFGSFVFASTAGFVLMAVGVGFSDLPTSK
jgi:hypothetical protein